MLIIERKYVAHACGLGRGKGKMDLKYFPLCSEKKEGTRPGGPFSLFWLLY
jgi:hypothetical protein